MKATTLAKIDSQFRSDIVEHFPPKMTVLAYSLGRKYFLTQLKNDIPQETIIPPEDLSRTLWNIKFRSPIMNAGGIFKDGDCYEMTAKEGAGAYLGGTGTFNECLGNTKHGIHLPFVPYPKSGSSSNFMGLPNKGDIVNGCKAYRINEILHTPYGWSVMASPNLESEAQNKGLVYSMRRYEDAGVNFLEWDIDCPNVTKEKTKTLEQQMSYVKKQYLNNRDSKIPVIIKISNDNTVEELPYLLDLIFNYGFHGINIGNTSTQYDKLRKKIHPAERKLFDYYTKTFGGGISGRPLKEMSLELAAFAVEYMKAGGPSYEFNVIRTGGIENWNDIMESERVGVKLNQWFTGYFEAFSRYGHEAYKNLYESRKK